MISFGACDRVALEVKCDPSFTACYQQLRLPEPLESMQLAREVGLRKLVSMASRVQKQALL